MTDWTKERDRLVKAAASWMEDPWPSNEMFRRGWDARDVEINARITDLTNDRDEWKRRAEVFEASRDKWMLAADQAYMEAMEYRGTLVTLESSDHTSDDEHAVIQKVLTRHPSQLRKLAEARERVINKAKMAVGIGAYQPERYEHAFESLTIAVNALTEAEKESENSESVNQT